FRTQIIRTYFIPNVSEIDGKHRAAFARKVIIFASARIRNRRGRRGQIKRRSNPSERYDASSSIATLPCRNGNLNLVGTERLVTSNSCLTASIVSRSNGNIVRYLFLLGRITPFDTPVHEFIRCVRW